MSMIQIPSSPGGPWQVEPLDCDVSIGGRRRSDAVCQEFTVGDAGRIGTADLRAALG